MKKFEFIYSDIKSKIEMGHYSVGTFLPKENDLADYYSVSRETLRKSQNKLEYEGYIKKIHGQGAKVLDFSKLAINTSTITSFSQLSSRYNGELQTKILKHRIDYLNPDEFGYDDVKEVPGISLERVRTWKNEAVLFDKDFFLLSEVVDDIPEEYLLTSVYDYFEKIKGLKISFAQKDITIEKPTKEIKLLLDLGEDTHVAVTRSKVFLENANLFQIHEAYQKVDTFHIFDIAHR